MPKSATAYQTVTRWLWRVAHGAVEDLLWPTIENSAYLRSPINENGLCHWRVDDQVEHLPTASCKQPACHASHILDVLDHHQLYGWNFRSRCKILQTLWSDTPKVSACLAAERCGNVVTACLTATIVSRIHTLQGLPEDFHFNAEEVCRKLHIHNNMFFLFGTLPCRPMSKWVQNWRWAASRNHHIWNRSLPQRRDAHYSRSCWQLKW